MTIYCADSVLGNNANSGVYVPSGATPDLRWVNAKKSLVGAWAVMSPGDTLYTRVGSLFSPQSGEGRCMVSYINKSNTLFESIARYPSDLTEAFPWDWRKSDLDGADYDITAWRGAGWNGFSWDAVGAGGWTHVGDGGANGPIGTYSKSPGPTLVSGSASQHVSRIFRDSTLSNAGERLTDIRIGQGMANAMSKTLLSAATPWYTPVDSDADQNVYMFTGSSSISPDNFFGGLCMIHNAALTSSTSGGSQRGFVVRNATNVTVKKMVVFGTYDSAFGCTNPSAAPNIADILFEDCYAVAWNSRAFKCGANATYPGSRVTHINCGAIALLGQTEELVNNLDDHRQGFEAFEPTSYMRDAVIYNPLVIDPFHGAFSITGGDDASSPSDCRVIGGAVKWSPWSTDGHPFALTRGSNNSIVGTLFDGCPTVAHSGGANNRVAGCYFRMRILNWREPEESRNVIDIRSLQPDSPSGGMIEDCTFDMTAMDPAFTWAAISYYGSKSSGVDHNIADNAYTVRNNLFILPDGMDAVARVSKGGGYCSPVQDVYGNRSCSPSNDVRGVAVVKNPSVMPVVRSGSYDWGSGAALYTHTQSSAASSWGPITHGLNTLVVDVVAFTGGGVGIQGTFVTVHDANSITIGGIGSSITGTAKIVKGGFTGDTNNARVSTAVANLDADGVPRLTSPFANILSNNAGFRRGRSGRMRELLSSPGCDDPVRVRALLGGAAITLGDLLLTYGDLIVSVS